MWVGQFSSRPLKLIIHIFLDAYNLYDFWTVLVVYNIIAGVSQLYICYLCHRLYNVIISRPGFLLQIPALSDSHSLLCHEVSFLQWPFLKGSQWSLVSVTISIDEGIGCDQVWLRQWPDALGCSPGYHVHQQYVPCAAKGISANIIKSKFLFVHPIPRPVLPVPPSQSRVRTGNRETGNGKPVWQHRFKPQVYIYGDRHLFAGWPESRLNLLAEVQNESRRAQPNTV